MTDPLEFVSDAAVVGDKPPARCLEPGCANPLERAGSRGPAPQYCAEHNTAAARRRRAAASQSANPPATPAAAVRQTVAWPMASEVEAALTEYVTWLNIPVMMVNELDGRILASGGPAVIHELVELAKGKSHVKLRKRLEALALPGEYSRLIRACLMGVALPIAANHGLIPPVLKFVVRSDDSRGEAA